MTQGQSGSLLPLLGQLFGESSLMPYTWSIILLSTLIGTLFELIITHPSSHLTVVLLLPLWQGEILLGPTTGHLGGDSLFSAYHHHHHPCQNRFHLHYHNHLMAVNRHISPSKYYRILSVTVHRIRYLQYLAFFFPLFSI